MNHPYSGLASYMYAQADLDDNKNHVDLDNGYGKSFMPMQSLDSVHTPSAHWPQKFEDKSSKYNDPFDDATTFRHPYSRTQSTSDVHDFASSSSRRGWTTFSGDSSSNFTHGNNRSLRLQNSYDSFRNAHPLERGFGNQSIRNGGIGDTPPVSLRHKRYYSTLQRMQGDDSGSGQTRRWNSESGRRSRDAERAAHIYSRPPAVHTVHKKSSVLNGGLARSKSKRRRSREWENRNIGALDKHAPPNRPDSAYETGWDQWGPRSRSRRPPWKKLHRQMKRIVLGFRRILSSN